MPHPTASISPYYALWFLILEPLGALLGGLSGYLAPHDYLNTLDPFTPPSFLAGKLLSAVHIVTEQLSNIWLLWAFNEAVVLRVAATRDESTSLTHRSLGMHWTNVDLTLWRVMLGGMLIADVGHLVSMRVLGSDVYWDVRGWNTMTFGNIGLAYISGGLRVLFLSGFGVRSWKSSKGKEE